MLSVTLDVGAIPLGSGTDGIGGSGELGTADGGGVTGLHPSGELETGRHLQIGFIRIRKTPEIQEET